MTKRAGIYIRVSSERQAEKTSPKTQEKDCIEYCNDNGYVVFDVYRDIEKYKSRGRMVEPSGTRNDRPQFKRMISDIDDGNIDLIVAWREDRLYRGVNRAMLEINERVTKKIVDVNLVKELYDPTVATVKAWAAGVELQAKQDRFKMGVAGRFEKGKIWSQTPPYGYMREDDYYEIDPTEAHWVKMIFEWYAKGEKIQDIRQRLIDRGAKQRSKKVKKPWHTPNLYKILNYEPYWTGKQIINWDDKEYKIDIPVIVDIETAQVCQRRREKYRNYPAGNYKLKALAAGLVYCHVCGYRMSISSNKNGYTRQDGKIKIYTNYACNNNYKNGKIEGCAGRASALKIDGQIWEKVWSLISIPGIFEEAIGQRISELQEQSQDAEEEYQKLSEQLDNLLMERQAVIGWARKNIITEDDLETQLLGLTLQQNEIEKEMNDTRLLLGDRIEKLQEIAVTFREQVKVGFEEFNQQPETPQLAKKREELKRKIINAIVERVDVFEDKSVKVYFLFDLTTLAGADSIVDINYLSSTQPRVHI